MSQPKTIKEIEKLFFDKFENNLWKESEWRGNSNQKSYVSCGSEIKQFWLEHFKSLLEEMRKPNREKPMGEDDNTNIICRDADGYNTRNAEINKHLDNLLSKGEVK